MNIPKSIEYNVLLIMLGGTISVLSGDLLLKLINSGDYPRIIIVYCFVVVGLHIFVKGFFGIKNKYELKLEIIELNYAKDKYELLKYFKKEKIINKLNENDFLNDINSIVNHKNDSKKTKWYDKIKKKSPERDLNSRPADYKSAALPN